MKSKIFNFNNAHAFSFAAAALVHGAIGAWALMPSKPVVINQQAIQISFVAPNSSEKSQKSEDKITQNVERENALKKRQNDKSAKAQNKDDNNLFAGKNTSGRQDPNATATKAAESEPVFNAAYLNNPAPEYPTIAKRRGIQGKVLVNVLVKADGAPALVEISRSSGSSDLDNAALDAVKQWKFIPARRGGASVQASVIVPVEFKII